MTTADRRLPDSTDPDTDSRAPYTPPCIIWEEEIGLQSRLAMACGKGSRTNNFRPPDLGESVMTQIYVRG